MPKDKVIERKFKIDPYQGFAAMSIALAPPKGYVFLRMERTGERAVIYYEKQETNNHYTKPRIIDNGKFQESHS
jgi:hypothetical protein